MSPSKTLLGIFVLGLGFVLSCSQANLRKIIENPKLDVGKDKLQINLSFCGTAPSEVEFPVKILFVMDNSDSLHHNDPDQGTPATNQRQKAIAEIWEKYWEDPNYSFSLIAFPGINISSNDPRRVTEGFVSKATTSLQPRDFYSKISNPAGLTPMYEALQEARNQIVNDINSYHEDRSKLSRVRYVVILFSDGDPKYYEPWGPIGGFPQDHKLFVNEEYQYCGMKGISPGIVQEIKCLEETSHLGSITMNSIFLSGMDPGGEEDRRNGLNLMTQIALAGGGMLGKFFVDGYGNPIGKSISFSSFDVDSYVRKFGLKSVLVSNRNAVSGEDGTLEPDTDGDGISDANEEVLEMNSFAANIDEDSCSDRVEQYLGLDPYNPNDCGCEETLLGDTDGDGLTDCIEKRIGTDLWLFDSDFDGLSDGSEFWAGSNPKQDDSQLDSDRDGVKNYQEIVQHTAPKITDPESQRTLAYQYDIQFEKIDSENRSCYLLDISNITLVPTGKNSDGRTGINRICIDVVEASSDLTLSTSGVLHTGCVEVQLLESGERNPSDPALKMDIDDSDIFKKFG